MNRTALLLAIVASLSANTESCRANNLNAPPNHSFDHVEIPYAHDECSFQYSPVDFCDERHTSEIKNALTHAAINFNRHYILLKIPEWKPSENYGYSLVAIDTRTGFAYPVPIDYYSGQTGEKNPDTPRKPRLFFSKNSSKLCIDGSILVYRATTNGYFCFDFDGEKFTGFHTEYMHQ